MGQIDLFNHLLDLKSFNYVQTKCGLARLKNNVTYKLFNKKN